MTFANIVDNFLRGAYPIPTIVMTLFFAMILILLFNKRILKKINLATKDDIAELRQEMKNGFLRIKENDLFHTNKAILLMARSLITNESTYGRIKDSIMENTPAHLREDLRDI